MRDTFLSTGLKWSIYIGLLLILPVTKRTLSEDSGLFSDRIAIRSRPLHVIRPENKLATVTLTPVVA